MKRDKRHTKVVAAVLLAGLAGLLHAENWPVVKTYDGEYLRRVKMPLGGIGTGTVSLSGRGQLVDWELQGKPAKGSIPNDAVAPAFLIRTESPDGKVTMRLMEGPIDTMSYEGPMGSRELNHGFPRFRDCQFKAAYPLAQVCLGDRTMPVSATLEAMNPLVQGDEEASGIPAALLRWQITNKTDQPLKVSVCGIMVTYAGGKTERVAMDEGELAAIRLGSVDSKPVDNSLGEVVLAVPKGVGEVARATRIANIGWIGFDAFVRTFVSKGKACDIEDARAKGNMRNVAAMSVTTEVAAKGKVTLPFVLAWRYPHRRAWTHGPQGHVGAFPAEEDVGNHYAMVHPTAMAAASKLWSGLAGYEAKTLAFVNGVLGINAPAVVKEAALFNLSTLRTETCFRTKDGHFFGWEGCDDWRGSCHGSCTHVWGYEHALVDVWPNLAKDMTATQFGPAMDAKGKMSFRVMLPIANYDAHNEVVNGAAAADGQMQCIIKAYENWKKSGDDAWIRKLYPRIRKALEYAWLPNGWDGDKDGVMEGCQHNTMDVDYYGPNPQMEFLYLAALKAMAAMAEFCGEADFAKDCKALAAKGSAWTEKNLFNGEYYEHKVRPMVGEPAPGTCTWSGGNPADPDYQLAKGCLVDQLLGDYASRVVGLGGVADEQNSMKAIETILKHNASREDSSQFNNMRDFAFPEEPALKMAWYPEGTMPRKPFPYYVENMTGFEYVVAANLAQRGDFKRAEKVVQDIRNRYDGRKRSPFDEAECGHHYARAMVAWNVLKAFVK